MAVNVSTDKSRRNNQSTLLKKAVAGKGKSPATYLASVKEEFGKITWTSREELVTYTKAVVGATLLFGIGVYLADLVIQLGLNSLETIFRLIFG